MRWDAWLKLLGKRGSLSTLLQCWNGEKQKQNKKSQNLELLMKKANMEENWIEGESLSFSNITWAQVPTLPVDTSRFNLDLSVTWNCWDLFVSLNQF